MTCEGTEDAAAAAEADENAPGEATAPREEDAREERELEYDILIYVVYYNSR